MAQWWWRGDGWQEICFKRVPEGWIFRAPNPWILGLHRHYLVSENQKTEIIAFCNQVNWRFVIVVGVFAVFFTAVLVLALSLVPSQTKFLVMIVFSFIIGYLINTYFWWTLRPLLVDVPRTTERITWGDRLRAWAAVMPIRQLIFCAIVLAILLALSAYLTLASGRWDIGGLIGTLLIGLMVAYCLVLLNAKRKTPAGPWS